ncbi:uncharacterized protein B0I36DRAFT_338732 [Microdochium trichocladiopsis]|uniref:Uncharacterized protein n=1 Tax=Microdochium trichocladiopsis TaxID=1682393 RepID=A0A9P8XSJ9_9PEZI|nr:uncharacterized protein B0I36DRAFT_338732 [Microdochium trichocladiopsis]KAH7014440.1 hypothetical protein B0I36DRAFT_338732 [Microdochium trichocladiopsis]
MRKRKVATRASPRTHNPSSRTLSSSPRRSHCRRARKPCSSLPMLTTRTRPTPKRRRRPRRRSTSSTISRPMTSRTRKRARSGTLRSSGCSRRSGPARPWPRTMPRSSSFPSPPPSGLSTAWPTWRTSCSSTCTSAVSTTGPCCTSCPTRTTTTRSTRTASGSCRTGRRPTPRTSRRPRRA